MRIKKSLLQTAKGSVALLLFFFLLLSCSGGDGGGNAGANFSGELTLNSGNTANVLSIPAHLVGSTTNGTVSAYLLSEDSTTPTADSTSWVAVEAPAASVVVDATFGLSASTGTHTVYAFLKNSANEVSESISNTVTVEASGLTGSITINEGGKITNNRNVTLKLSALSENTITGYVVSESATVPATTDGGWSTLMSIPSPPPLTLRGGDEVPPLRVRGGEGEIQSDTAPQLNLSALTKTVSYSLSAGDGAKTVYLHLRDINNKTGSASSAITLDTTAPTGSLKLNGGAKLTLTAAVTEALTATDTNGVTAYVFSTSSTAPAATDSSWTTVASTTSLTNSTPTTLGNPLSGKKTLYAYLKDSAGNVGALSGSIEMVRFLSTSVPAEDWGLFSSIAVDSTGAPFISVYSQTYGDLVLNSGPNFGAPGNNTFTSQTTRDSTGNIGAGTSIAVDRNNKLHIAYRDTTNGQLKYATNAGGSWGSETIEAGGISPSIAVDSNNTVHISHQTVTGSNDKVRYVTGTSGNWSKQQILTNGTYAYTIGSSLTLDSNNKIHIIGGAAGLHYATNTSGSFVESVVASGVTIGFAPRIKVDSKRVVYISYDDAGTLKLASNGGGGWTLTTIDSPASVNVVSSLAFDSQGFIHIIYYGGSSDLKYATNYSGSWVTYTLDSTGDVGNYCDIAIDANDRLHISYYDATNGELKYASTTD